MSIRAAALLAILGVGAAGRSNAQESPRPPLNYPARYMGGPANLGTAPNGAVVYDRLLKVAPEVFYLEKTVAEVTDGVWVIGGYALTNCIVIEAPEGLIVYDTGDNAATGKLFRELIEAKISRRPIKAFIYSHSHYPLGTGAMVDDPASVEVIGHPEVNATVEANLRGGGAPSAIPELGPVLTARAAVQFNNFLPADGPDAGLMPGLTVKRTAYLPVTRTVEDGETLNVAGLELQFFTRHISDDHSVTVWIPGKKAALNNFFWPGTPNLYTLRGAVHRDPTQWRDGLKVLRDLRPEHLVNTHARSISGREEVFETLTNYMDLITLTYDQTLRGILRGLGPDDLRYFVYTPRRLADPSYNAQTYGETTWFPPSTFLFQFGWYDRDATTIFKLPPRDEAERLVALMGGRERVIEEARKALEKKEYAWAAQLINYVSILDPNDREARQVKADALRKLGQLASGAIGRAFLLSEARALEGETQIPRLIPPPPEIIAASPATFVDYHRVRIDPRKAEDVDQVVTFTFGDATVGLHVRRGVAEFLPEPARYFRQADVALSMDGATWASLYLNRSNLGDEIEAGKVKVTHGDTVAAQRILDLFDRFDPVRNVTIPPLHD